jgi:hypothetical protein
MMRGLEEECVHTAHTVHTARTVHTHTHSAHAPRTDAPRTHVRTNGLTDAGMHARTLAHLAVEVHAYRCWVLCEAVKAPCGLSARCSDHIECLTVELGPLFLPELLRL